MTETIGLIAAGIALVATFASIYLQYKKQEGRTAIASGVGAVALATCAVALFMTGNVRTGAFITAVLVMSAGVLALDIRKWRKTRP